MKSWPKPDYTEIPLHRRRRLKELVYKVTKLGRIFMHSPPLPNILPPGFDPCLIMSDKEKLDYFRDFCVKQYSIDNPCPNVHIFFFRLAIKSILLMCNNMALQLGRLKLTPNINRQILT